MKVSIRNGHSEILLDFSDETGEIFIKAVENCLSNPVDYPFINYQDKKDKIIFTAQYLANSLIKIPNE